MDTIEWHSPVSDFAKSRGYRFKGDLAFCRVNAAFGETGVELLISNVGAGGPRNTVASVVADYGVVHCRAEAKIVGELKVEVRRRTLFDRLISRGVRLGVPAFDSKYVAIGAEEDVRRFLSDDIVKRFVAMWDKTEGLEVDDGKVTVSGGRFLLTPDDLALIIDTLGAIATSHARRPDKP